MQYPQHLNNVPRDAYGAYPPADPGGPFTEIDIVVNPGKAECECEVYEFDPNLKWGERVIPNNVRDLLKSMPGAKFARTAFRTTLGDQIPEEFTTYDQIITWVEEKYADKIALIPVPPGVEPFKKKQVEPPPALASNKVKVSVVATVKMMRRARFTGEVEIPKEISEKGKEAVDEHIKSVFTTLPSELIVEEPSGKPTNIKFETV
jgi:hypothetical protein